MSTAELKLKIFRQIYPLDNSSLVEFYSIVDVGILLEYLQDN
jgi:hypothetical protein